MGIRWFFNCLLIFDGPQRLDNVWLHGKWNFRYRKKIALTNREVFENLVVNVHIFRHSNEATQNPNFSVSQVRLKLLSILI